MPRANEIKRGFVVEHEGRIWVVRDTSRSAPTARGGNTLFRFRLEAIPGGERRELTETAPVLKGATASRSAKPATTETSLEVMVPDHNHPGREDPGQHRDRGVHGARGVRRGGLRPPVVGSGLWEAGCSRCGGAAR